MPAGSTSTIAQTALISETKSKGDAQLEEFMKVMKPRTGPAWANEATAQPTVSVPKTDDTTMQDAEPEPRQDDVSDLEWMKQRMSKNVDVVEKAFEQSDDEGELHNKETLVKQPISLSIYIYHTNPVR